MSVTEATGMRFVSCIVSTIRLPLEGNWRFHAPTLGQLVGEVREVDDAHPRRGRASPLPSAAFSATETPM